MTTKTGRQGAVLLEVILALTLFVVASTVITSALTTSIRTVERLKLNLHASDLAFSVLSELQMGITPVEAVGAQPFEAPFDMWSWELKVTPFGDTLISPVQLQNIEIIVRHTNEPVVRRLTQLLPVKNPAAPEEGSGNASAGPANSRAGGLPQN